MLESQIQNGLEIGLLGILGKPQMRRYLWLDESVIILQ